MLLILLIAALVIAMSGLPSLLHLAADWYWFQALGFEPVFVTTLVTKVLVGSEIGRAHV